MVFKYDEFPYPRDIGIKLPSVSVTLFPHRMTEAEVRLLLDEMPHLRKFWATGTGDGGGGSGSCDTADKNGNGVPDNLDFAWNGLLNLDPLLQALIAANEALSTTVRSVGTAVSAAS